ncbi:hypothetical protein FA95DRAFT_1564844 [Auriscalpium vulgare]|uniref:Uncharacterized protein n=1 Tax=Auriscalpium vulgare TaxID=40419 RepID=A0ACB8RED0_9AGAM|nr:hypothetical protein FA95DRAFT_1564844 [Auriscalpium vulgare]
MLSINRQLPRPPRARRSPRRRLTRPQELLCGYPQEMVERHRWRGRGDEEEEGAASTGQEEILLAGERRQDDDRLGHPGFPIHPQHRCTSCLQLEERPQQGVPRLREQRPPAFTNLDVLHAVRRREGPRRSASRDRMLLPGALQTHGRRLGNRRPHDRRKMASGMSANGHVDARGPLPTHLSP